MFGQELLRAFFAIDQKPTGSKDPFALRRAAIASIEIIVSNALRMPLTQAIRGSLANRAGQIADAAPAHQLDRTAPDILDFFADRLKVQQREAGVRHDLIDAVFALGGEDDLVRLLARVKALQTFVESVEGADLHTAYKRAANILKREEWDASRLEPGSALTSGASEEGRRMPDQVRHDGWPEQERALVDALDAAEPRASAAVEAEDLLGEEARCRDA